MSELLILCPITDAMRTRLSASFQIHDAYSDPQLVDQLPRLSASLHSILTDGHIGVPHDILALLPDLKIISSYGVGYDAIDVQAASKRGVPVCHTPGVLSEEVSTTAVMLYLAIWRNFEAQAGHARSGAWSQGANLPLSHTADGRTVGILGLGRIGLSIARKLEAFGATILYNGRSEKDVPYAYYPNLMEMAHQCETLICAAPGDASTHHLINSDVISAIGETGYLVNVGRGSTVDEQALIHALQTGHLAGAALDVFENEPNIPDDLRSLPNVILTPHIGSATVETRRAMGDLAIDNLLAHLEGRPLLTPVPESKDDLGL